MTKQRKTALDKACDWIVANVDNKLCYFGKCKLKEKKECNFKNCVKKHKKYFQQQADTPDGWDVVSDIYGLLKDVLSNLAPAEVDFSSIYQIKSICECIKNTMKQAGIEVDDE